MLSKSGRFPSLLLMFLLGFIFGTGSDIGKCGFHWDGKCCRTHETRNESDVSGN